jgi:hypothetical protein
MTQVNICQRVAVLAALLTSLGLAGQANAVIIKASILENAYIEALPDEASGSGLISLITPPESGIGSVTNSDPTFFSSGDEEDAQLRTRDNSSIESVQYRIQLTEIEVGANEGRVYGLDVETGELTFSDGQQGATLPQGGVIVATYEVGGGGAGIKSIFEIDPLDLLPFLIPLVHFSTDDQGKPDFRLVFSGISAIVVFPTNLGLLVSGIQPTGVPEPTTLGLLGAGLLGLFIRRRRTA